MDELQISMLLGIGVTAAVATFLLTFPIKRLSYNLGVLDIPDERKIHIRKIPCLGGLSLYITAVLTFSIMMRLYPAVFVYRQEMQGLILGSALMVAFGVWDDVRGSGAIPKLAFQSLIALIMYEYGFRFQTLSLPLLPPVYLGIFGMILTIVWFCVVINAINLIDGLDGLAAGLSVIAAATILMISYRWSEPLAILLAVLIIGTSLGFLPHNFYPAKIFLGDTGSMLLGFWLASLSLITSTKSPTLLTLLLPLIAIGLPVFDTVHAFFRRLHHRQHPFRADKRHIHHRLLALGYSHPHSVILLYLASIYLGLTAYILSQTESFVTLLTLVLLVLGIVLLISIFRKISDNAT